jgi:hypothetical protein
MLIQERVWIDEMLIGVGLSRRRPDISVSSHLNDQSQVLDPVYSRRRYLSLNRSLQQT